MTKKTFLLILIAYVIPFAQNADINTDSLFRRFVEIRFGEGGQPEMPGHDHVKCGFTLVNNITLNFDRFTKQQQETLKPLLQRMVRDKSIISPSGKFRVHYNVSGNEIPKYISTQSADQNALLVAEALDSSYNFEVTYLGYPPPKDNGDAGAEYDVYVADLGSQLYGYTQFENEVIPGTSTYYTYMVLDNDYAGFYSPGIAGARVTAAHELHHGIQVGNYIYRDQDSYYFEITSTAMEEFVYDSINDYYAYMGSYFQNMDLSITQHLGYNLAILNLFLEAQFDHSLLKRIWELMPGQNALSAINTALVERGSSFDVEYHTLGVWSFFTKYRSVEGRFFEEAGNYPLVRPLLTMNFSPPEDTVQGNSKPAGHNFIFFIKNPDTITVLISNSDITSAYTNPMMNQPYRYILYNYNAPGSTILTEDYSMHFQTNNPDLWATTEILNNIIVRSGDVIVSVVAADDYAKYPDNPGQFILSRTGDNTNPLIIDLSISGTAEPGVHYNVLPSPVEIPAGESRILLDVIPLENEEPIDKTVTITINENEAYAIGIQNRASVLIDLGASLATNLVYPTPFRYNNHTLIYIPVEQNNSGSVDFNVFSTSMDLIYGGSERIQFIRGSFYAITWDALNNSNEKLATGVYFYVIKAGDDVKKGKLLIFND